MIRDRTLTSIGLGAERYDRQEAAEQAGVPARSHLLHRGHLRRAVHS